MTPEGRAPAPVGRDTGNTPDMPFLTLRDLVLAAWLAVLLVHGERGPRTVAIAVALISVWAVALLRDRRRRPAMPRSEGRRTGIRPS